MKLTKTMREVLANADLDSGQLNNVSMGTMYGFEARGLVSSDWRRRMSPVIQTTCGGMFPRYSHVTLTTVGLRAARSVQGLRADL